jgi:nucleotide-binding universal stress UspA family protein
MPTFRSILCAIDFSSQSGLALCWAKRLRDRHGSRLIVVSAVDPLLDRAARIRLGLDLARTETRPALEEFVRSSKCFEGIVPAHLAYEARVGDPADVILESTARGGATLIVMGTQGLGGYRKWVLGSATERVLRRTHVPVLAVPPTAGEPTASLDLRRIVVATDFSDASGHAVRAAAGLAKDFGASLLVTHVVEPGGLLTHWRANVDVVDAARLADARERLETVAAEAGAGGETLVRLGSIADSIASTAEEREAGLIVVGLTGQSAAHRRPGSIAYRILCLAKAPVLVVPAAEASHNVTA